MRKRLLELTFLSGKNGAHIGGSLSTVETLTTLYFNHLKYDLNNPKNISRDRFILSKGHSAMALFAILEQIGYIEKKELDTFESNGSKFYAHAKKDLELGIEFSGGSLSLGLSYAVGVAIICKRKKINNHIYVMVGDGECDEGLVWESLMSAANFKLNNLTIIVDCNGFQSDGLKKNVMKHFSLHTKLESFGFNTISVDGHNINEINSSLKNKSKDTPNALICKTKKGKGISFMELNGDWHHGVLNKKLYDQAISELK